MAWLLLLFEVIGAANGIAWELVTVGTLTEEWHLFGKIAFIILPFRIFACSRQNIDVIRITITKESTM